MSWDRRALAASAFLASLFGAMAASVPATALVERVGAHELVFEWQPAPGDVEGYIVSVARDGAPSQVHELVFGRRATVPVDGAREIAVFVRAFGFTPDRDVIVGPRSPTSETVRIDDPPAFAVPGLWTLHCGACERLALRRISGSSLLASFPAPSTGWDFGGYAAMRPGAPLALWHHPPLAAIVLTDPFASSLHAEAFLTGPAAAERDVAGIADFLGTGRDDLVLRDLASGALELWRLDAASHLAHSATIEAPPGRRLLATADVTGDGRDDLLWREPASGRVEAWVPGGGVHRLGTLPDGSALAAVADLDGDGPPDLLWRSSDGSLTVWRLVDGDVRNTWPLPAAPDDERRRVVGTLDLDGVPGAEIAVQHRDTGDLEIIFPLRPRLSERVLALTPGSQWRAVDVRN